MHIKCTGCSFVYFFKKIIACRTVFGINLRLCSKYSQHINFFIEDIIWYFKVSEDWSVRPVYYKHGTYTTLGSFVFKKLFLQTIFCACILPILNNSYGKGKTIPIQAWTSPSGSRRLIRPEFVENRHAKDGIVVSPTRRPPLLPT